MSIYIIKRGNLNIGYAYTESDAQDIVRQFTEEANEVLETRLTWLAENPEPELTFGQDPATWDSWDAGYQTFLTNISAKLADNWVDRWSFSAPAYNYENLQPFELEFELVDA